ncbi:alkyl hydroperoxide reductase protein F [Liquorilactobacillus sucicola DSM 21376 = JCM 15457]|uniref:FAD-dependent pyridine nucleotide-disulfide oxidoreductase n=1 Tax=Liquorilactobacillus sucicola DSM 21376 = JCM 15457 TaxID=1423806 RepID=A0A023D099_9LACO|nr:FAD-dependent oxidoreductase [Liquorilactobacillus sucicola]KRN06581.1 FAD-dependent pyridine nucleotide-disulfide oxidoreductase [Liquorilactobacillus sucicola DSM 21376 = JCM 15457]GAJ27165.1 alkyl hydroperoxide reductase protein F [Liquorilactobacillus sucicola DSM 21376 = JCM 15457]
MTEKHIYDTIIIGAGPAGLSAGIYAGRATLDTLIIENDQVGGQVTTTSVVWNYPAVEKIDGTALMNKMQHQAVHFGAEITRDNVESYDFDGDVKIVHGAKQDYYCRSVILATGAKPRKLGFQGEEEFKGRGVAYCSTCDGELFSGMQVFVVGGGYAAAEEADYLTRYARHVTVLVREPEFTCAPLTAARALNNPKVDVKFNTELAAVQGKNYLTSARLVNNKTGKETSYHVPEGEQTFGVFVYVGTQPATAELADTIKCDEHGYIKVDDCQSTNKEGVFAAGDVVAKPLRQIVTAASDGASAATAAEHYVTVQKQRLNIPIHPAAATQEQSAKTFGQTTDLETKAKKQPVHEGQWFNAELQTQLQGVFSKLESDITLLHLDDGSAKSQELGAFAKEFAAMDKHVHYELKHAVSDEQRLPALSILDAEENTLGIRFSGIPTGHELNSLVLALYNAAGPGQAIEPALEERIKALPKTKIEIGIALTCHFCPDVVAACQHMAILNPAVSAEMIDLQMFPELRNEKHIMSVPATIINDGDVIFGSQTLEQLVTACEKIAAV